MSPAGVLFATFAVLMLLGSPITVALGVAAMAALYTVDQNLVTLVQIAFTSVNSFPIMALPAFMLVGALMECAGISRRLVAIAENIVGPIPGGLAVSTALACVFFGAISGSGPATTAAVGMLMIPAMIRRGFSKGYAAAAAATAGGVGIIIPPSIPMVVYAVSGQQSITKMFLAGVMPGIMIAVGLAAMHLFLCRNMPVAEDLQSGSGDSLLKALKDGLWSLMAPVVILGGIYGGFFTPTEAAVVAIFYSIFVGLFIHRELTFGGIRHSLQITSWMTGRVLIIMFTAYAFERLLVQYRIPDMIVEHILGFTSDVAVIWMFVIALLLFVTRVDAFGLKEILKGIYIPIHNILGVEGLSLDFQWAYNPGIFPFGVVALVTALIRKVPGRETGQVAKDTARQMANLIIALIAGVAMVQLMMHSGENGSGLDSMLSQISQLMVDLVGSAFPYMSPVIGIFGAFVSGSCTVSSTLFGPLQYETAQLLGLSTTTIVALQITGGALGNMICINNVVAVTSTTNAPGSEGKIIRTNLLPCLIYCAIVWVLYLGIGI